jgi:hypothetical protein
MICRISHRLVEATQQRHKWTEQEVLHLLDKYREQSSKLAPDGTFSLKEFIQAQRGQYSFFDELSDQQFYERVKRLLYRVLGKYGLAWKHSNKKLLKDNTPNTQIKKALERLEEEGVFVATTGEILMTFALSVLRGQDEGYWLPDIVKALAHLRKVAGNPQKEMKEVADQAQIVIPLLQHFLDLWNQVEEPEKFYQAPEHKNLIDDGYKLTRNPNNPSLVTIEKPDGTTYQVDKDKHTCTCPAGVAGRSCKHLTYTLLNLRSL